MDWTDQVHPYNAGPTWFRTWMQMFAASGDLGNLAIDEAERGNRVRLSLFCAKFPMMHGRISIWWRVS
jgi:hypothetical protein